MSQAYDETKTFNFKNMGIYTRNVTDPPLKAMDIKFESMVNHFESVLASETQARTDADTDINNRLDALTSRVTTLEANHQQLYNYVHNDVINKINTLDKRVTNEVNTLNARINSEVQTLNARIDSLESNLRALINTNISDIAALKSRMTSSENNITNLSRSLINLSDAHTALDTWVHSHYTELATQLTPMSNQIVVNKNDIARLRADFNSFTRSITISQDGTSADTSALEARLTVAETTIASNASRVQVLENRMPSIFKAATASKAGTSGTVPIPPANSVNWYLTGGCQWVSLKLAKSLNVADLSKDGLMSSADKDKLDNIAAGANKYILPKATSTALGGITVGDNITVSDGKVSITKSNVTTALGYTPQNSTVAFTGATADKAGNIGLVPAPAKATQNAYFLKANGSWAIPPNATTSVAGYMSAADKTKLDGITAGANKYTLPKATSSTLGGVTVGTNITVSDGKISLTQQNVLDALGQTSVSTSLPFKGASASAAGGSGLVPAPAKGTQDAYFLKADGNWTIPPSATQSAAGYMSAADKKKLDNIPATFTNYTLPVATSTVLGGIKVGANLSITSAGVLSATNTTYSAVTTSANGLMTIADKKKLDGITAGANNYSLPTASSSVLGGVKVGSNITLSSGVISVSKANVLSALNLETVAPDTVFTSSSANAAGKQGLVPAPAKGTQDAYFLKANATWAIPPNATQSAAGYMTAADKKKLDGIAAGANAYSLPIASSTVLGGIKVGTNLSITSAGVLSATNTTYGNATSSAAGLMSTADKNKLDGITAGANKYVLPTASSTLGGVKTTSSVTSTSGLVACPIISGVVYYQNTNTTYSQMTAATASADGTGGLVPKPTKGKQDAYFLKANATWSIPPNATTSAAGYMSAADKVKLDGIAANANKYVLPTASSTTIGGVKTTSSVTSTSGLVACPIIAGVVYYQNTNTTYGQMKGATADAAGTAGLVPAPAKGKQTSFLRGDGAWVVPTNTTYATVSTSNAGLAPALPSASGDRSIKFLRADGTWQIPPSATQSAVGYMSAADKKKLDGITAGANAYSLPTASSSTLGGVRTTSTVTSASGYIACPIIGGIVYYQNTNTTYGQMTGATADKAGTTGLVPAPAKGKQASYLRGDGAWAIPTNTTYGKVSDSADGLCPKFPSNTSDRTVKFLRADGTWQTPAYPSTSGFLKSSDLADYIKKNSNAWLNAIEFAGESADGGYLDFHYAKKTSSDYTSRIIESSEGTLWLNGVTIVRSGTVVNCTTLNATNVNATNVTATTFKGTLNGTATKVSNSLTISSSTDTGALGNKTYNGGSAVTAVVVCGSHSSLSNYSNGSNNQSATGWIKTLDGTIINYGRYSGNGSTSGSTSRSITFPKSYSTGCIVAVTAEGSRDVTATQKSVTKTGATLYSTGSGVGFTWIAIGR